MTLEDVAAVVDRILRWLLVALMGVAVLNVLWQVFTRFVVNAPSGFTEELARYLLIWVGILGSGYAAGTRSHLALELLPEALEGAALHRLRIVIELCMMTFAVVVMVGGGLRLVYVMLQAGQTSSALNLLVGYVYTVVPLSGLVIAFYNVVHIVEEVRALRDSETADPPSAHA